MLENQKHLEDGDINRENYSWSDNLSPVFDEILSFKYLNKLIIELPFEDFPANLKRLSIRIIITVESLAVLKIRNMNLTTLAIEGIYFFARTYC